MVGVIEDVAEVARWARGIEGVHECIAGRFRRPEPRRRALDYLRGLLSPVERKNGWQLAEQAGDATPYGVQRLLSTYVWDADLVRDDLREYVVEHLGDVHGVLVVDETGFLKKGNKSVGVQRQYSGTAGRIENCQIGVFLTYASAQGRTLLDRELYLPRVWADDLERRREAGVPEQVAFRTKPQLARRMLERALESGVPFGWVTGDEVYGNDRNLRLWLERRDVPHVLAVRSNEKLWAETDRGWRPVRADRLAPGVEEPGWVRRSAGDGAKGPRVYDWARVEIRPLKEPGKGYWLLVRRSIAKPGELAYYVCFGPVDTTLEELVRVAGTRWTIEGPSKNALRRPRERWVWTSMKSGNGMAGTGTSPWRCWPTPAWRWSGARRWNKEVREKRGLSQLGRKADTPDGARGPAVALPADMETSTYGRISAAVVPVETAAPGNGPALPLPTPPETPHHISATVVLAGGAAPQPAAADAHQDGHGNVYDCPVLPIGLVVGGQVAEPIPEVQQEQRRRGVENRVGFEVQLQVVGTVPVHLPLFQVCGNHRDDHSHAHEPVVDFPCLEGNIPARMVNRSYDEVHRNGRGHSHQESGRHANQDRHCLLLTLG